MDTYARWAFIRHVRGWALVKFSAFSVNKRKSTTLFFLGGAGAYSRLGVYQLS